MGKEGEEDETDEVEGCKSGEAEGKDVKDERTGPSPLLLHLLLHLLKKLCPSPILKFRTVFKIGEGQVPDSVHPSQV